MKTTKNDLNKSLDYMKYCVDRDDLVLYKVPGGYWFVMDKNFTPILDAPTAAALNSNIKAYTEGYLAAKHNNFTMRNEINTLTASVSELKMLVEELKPYRDGYDANEILPEEGENVFAETQNKMFLAQCRGGAWYYSFGDKSKVINEVKRWWKLPDM